MNEALWRVVDRIGSAALGNAWMLARPAVRKWMESNPAVVAESCTEVRRAVLAGEL